MSTQRIAHFAMAVAVAVAVLSAAPAHAQDYSTRLVGDGGDCNFPVSNHPHTSAGATSAFAVWIGFVGPISGKCVVTITLNP